MIEQTRSPLATRPPQPSESPPPLPETPFVGLVPFEVGDAPFFFGRERERRLIAANLMASRLTLLYGPSGVGKSSVLRAGVEHDLRERARRDLARGILPEWVPIVFSSWSDDPIAALRDGIASALLDIFGELAPDPPPAARLEELLAGWIERLDVLAGPEEDDRRLRLLIVLDQFEEYFLYHGDEDGEGTLAVELPRAVNREGLRANFAISIREDAYARLDRFKGRIPNLFDSYFRIRQLGHDAAKSAVIEPIEVYNKRLPANELAFEIEPELVEAVLNEVKTGTVVLGQAGGGTVEDTSEARIEAPFLQLVMRRLWHDARSRGNRKLSRTRLHELGGAASIVGAHLREAMESLDPAESDLAAPVFHQLVTPSGTKIAHTIDDLATYAGVSREQLRPTLEKLARTRILRPVDPPPGETAPRFEIFHDVLAAAVLDWRAAHVREQEEEERRHVDRRRFRARLVTIVGGVLAVGSVAVAGLAVWAWIERSRAQDAAKEATSLSVAAASKVQLDAGRADVALLIGLEAYRLEPRAEARSSIVDALVGIRGSGAYAILRAQTSKVAGITISRDGRTLASAGADGRVRLWDVRRRKPLGEPFRAHAGPVLGVALTSDARMLASAGADGTVRLWDVGERKRLGPPLRGHVGRVLSVAFRPGGDVLASAGEDGTVRLWSVEEHRAMGEPLDPDAGQATSLAFGPDGALLASGHDGTVVLWDVARGSPTGRLDGHVGVVRSVAVGSDGKVLASAGDDGTVRLWNLGDRTQLGEPLVGHGGQVLGVAFSADAEMLASAGQDMSVRVWNLRSRALLDQPRILSGHAGSVSAVVFGPDRRTLASASADGTVRLWDVRAPDRLSKPVAGRSDPVFSVAFSSDRGTLASAGLDGTIRLWDVEGRQLGEVRRRHVGPVYSVAFSPDGQTLASAGDDKTVRLWDVAGRLRLRATLEGHTAEVLSVAFSADGKLLASAGVDGAVRLWDSVRGTSLRPSMAGGSGAVSTVAFSPSGDVLASAGERGTVQLWDVPRRAPIGRLAGHAGFVRSVAFGPEGDTLASAGDDGTIRLWNVEGRQPLGESMRGHSGSVSSVAFAPDGITLASAGDDGTVRLWDGPGRKAIGSLTGHGGPVYSVAFSPNGRTFASGGQDAARLWEGIVWEDLDELEAQVCSTVVGNLTVDEWIELVPLQAYRSTCPA